MGFGTFLLLFLVCISASFAQKVENAELVVDSKVVLTDTDDNYVCATLDWWPHDKCNYYKCPWGSSSVLSLDLSHPLLATAVQAFGHLRIRIGGSLQDQVEYDVGNLKSPCTPFRGEKYGLFGFSKGCLHTTRWDALNQFFKKTGAIVTFGLNALYGRHHIRKGVWGGDWNSSNAHDFIKYTISKGYQIDSWEYGNELSGKGIGASVGAEQYGKDLIKLNALIEELYQHAHSKPSLLAPGGFYNKQWFAMILQVSGPHVVNVMTHHIYNLGPGVDHNLIDKILDPHYLNRISNTYSNLTQTLEMNGPWASAWVGESGGAFNSGGHNVSDTFVYSFWYLDQLGMAATYKTKVYCRQTLVGGHYGLLSRHTFVPNPDYYSGLLWHRIMGKGVLNVCSNALPYLRSYAHCSKGRTGLSLLLINLSNQTHFNINVESTMNINWQGKTNNRKLSIIHDLKRTVSWIGNKASEEKLYREEYHLTPKDGDLRSKTMLLNGRPLELTFDGNIPTMDPVLLDVHSSITIPPLSIKFVVLPNFDAPGCSF